MSQTAFVDAAIKPASDPRPNGYFGVKTMAWQEFKGYMIDGLFVLGGIAVGGPAIIIMATLFSGGI